ncbi:MAG: hypothetical protein QOF04_2033, partial [Solirubrobacteraceae bacterium]|nr:hypothetical protein [Solirubrobacteraceae bacterium]
MRGRDGAAVVALWALLNLVLSSLMFVFTTDLMSHAVYWGAVALEFAHDAVAWVSREPPRRRVPEASAGTFVLAVAIAFLALGAGIGLWAALIG